MNIILTESQYSRIFLFEEEDYRQTFNKYITNINQGNAFRKWVISDKTKYDQLVTRMKQAKYSDPSLGPSGSITNPHIMLAWQMFGNDYINRNNVQSSGLSKQAQQDWQARQTMNKYLNPGSPDYVGKDHVPVDNTATTYQVRDLYGNVRTMSTYGLSEKDAAAAANTIPWCLVRGNENNKNYKTLCPNPEPPVADAWDRMFNTLEEAWEYAKEVAVGAWEWTKEKLSWFVTSNLSKVMEGLRSWLTGAAGTIVNTILDLTGIGRLATSAQWAALALYDYSKNNWIKFIFSCLGLLAGGAVGKALYKPFQAIWSTKVASWEQGIEKVIKQPTIKGYLAKITKTLIDGVRGAAEGIKTAGNWLINTFNLTWARTGINWLVTSLGKIVGKLTGETSEKVLTNTSKKIFGAGLGWANDQIANQAGVKDEYSFTKATAGTTKGGDPAKSVGSGVKLVDKWGDKLW